MRDFILSWYLMLQLTALAIFYVLSRRRETVFLTDLYTRKCFPNIEEGMYPQRLLIRRSAWAGLDRLWIR